MGDCDIVSMSRGTSTSTSTGPVHACQDQWIYTALTARVSTVQCSCGAHIQKLLCAVKLAASL